MKKISVLIFAIMSFVNSYAAPSQPIEIVQAYADNLSAWSETKDVAFYSGAIQKLCDTFFKVNDDIISDYIRRTNITPRPLYNYDDYEKCLRDIISRGGHFSIKDIVIDNSAEFNVARYGYSEPIAFVSGELTIAGGVNYKIKEVFRIKGGKITHILNYDGDKKLNKAFALCKEGKFQEAYDLFEQIMYTSENYGEKRVATKFSVSILLKKGNKLSMDEYIRKYKLARNIFIDNMGVVRDPDYPMLDDKTFSYYAANYESDPNYRNRVAVLPANWKKGIPYTGLDLDYSRNLWIYRYYANIGSRYRQIEKTRFPKVSKNLYGYVDENGKEIIPMQYKFAYPFDEVAGLALVQNADGKWGYIDLQGRPRTAQNFDVASDVFVNGKTNAIRDGHLILLDTQGNELSSLYGYTDLSHKLEKDEMLAINTIESERADLIDFSGNIIRKGSLKKDGTDAYYSATKLQRAYEDTGGCSLSYARHTIGQQLSETDNISQQKIVDLGLSVKWAGWNIGATLPEEDGTHCGWADPTGVDDAGKDRKKPVRDSKTNEWISSSYGGINPPEKISGTSLDIATAQWGKGWRLPTKAEIQELIDKCQWKKVTFKGVLGYIVTGPNQNKIFLRIGEYWSGDLDTSSKWKNALVLKLDGREAPNVHWEWRDRRPCVRPIYEQ